MRPNLSIIIVNYKSLPLIDDCLQSIHQYDDAKDFEILIIDNSDDDPSEIIKRFPNVQWISMGYNLGFARANNKGMHLAKGEVVLLLNPDVLVEDNAISSCFNNFISSDHVACGVQLLNLDKTPQISGSYFMKGGLNNLLPLPILGNVFKELGNALKVKKPSIDNANGVMEVDWINGAFLMVKKAAIEKAGHLDEDFFLYAEEIEWCSRLRKQGRVCIYGDLHVIHLQGEAANEAFNSKGKGYYDLFDKKGRQIMLSNFVRIRKQFGLGWFIIHLLFYLVDIPVFFLGVLFQKIFFVKNSFSFSQFFGYCRNLFYLLGKSIIIAKNKPYFYKAYN